MVKIIKNIKNDERGTVLAVAVLLAVILAGLGTALMLLLYNQHQAVKSDTNTNTAIMIADGAVSEAIAKVDKGDPEFTPTSTDTVRHPRTYTDSYYLEPGDYDTTVKMFDPAGKPDYFEIVGKGKSSKADNAQEKTITCVIRRGDQRAQDYAVFVDKGAKEYAPAAPTWGDIRWKQADVNNGIDANDNSLTTLVPDPANGNIFYAGTSLSNIYRGLYDNANGENLTTDSITWAKLANLTSTEYCIALQVKALAIDTTNTNYVYMAATHPSNSAYHGIYISWDGGNSWFMGGGTSGIIFRDIAIDPNNTSIIYAAAEAVVSGQPCVMYSNNRGVSWGYYGGGALPNNTPIYALSAVNVGGTTYLYAGGQGKYYGSCGHWHGIIYYWSEIARSGIFRKIGSDNWTRIDIGMHRSQVTSGHGIPSGAPSGCPHTGDGGCHIALGDDYWFLNVTDIAIDPTNAANIAIATQQGNEHGLLSGHNDGIFVSTNSGGNWTKKGMVNREMMSVVVVNSTNIIAGDTGSDPGIFQTTTGFSAPGTDDWQKRQVTTDVRTLFRDPDNSQILYVGSNEGVWKSTNSGTNWIQKNVGLPVLDIDALSGKGSVIWCGTWSAEGFGPYVSLDGGENWSSAGFTGLPTGESQGNPGAIQAIAIDPTNSNIIYMGTNNNGVYKTTDGGLTWVNQPTSKGYSPYPGKNTTTIVINKYYPNVCYAGAYNGGIRKTTNGGTNWYECPGNSDLSSGYGLGVHGMDIESSNSEIGVSDILYLGSDSWDKPWPLTDYPGMFKSTNGGNNFSRERDGIGGFADDNITVYDVGVNKFSLEGQPLPIYLATSWCGAWFGNTSGVYYSQDRADNWDPRGNGIGNNNITLTTIAKCPQDENYMYCGAGFRKGPNSHFAEGVWYSENGGENWSSGNGSAGDTLGNKYVNQLLAYSQDPGIVFAATEGKIWRGYRRAGGADTAIKGGLYNFLDIGHWSPKQTCTNPCDNSFHYLSWFSDTFRTAEPEYVWDNPNFTQKHSLNISVRDIFSKVTTKPHLHIYGKVHCNNNIFLAPDTQAWFGGSFLGGRLVISNLYDNPDNPGDSSKPLLQKAEVSTGAGNDPDGNPKSITQFESSERWNIKLFGWPIYVTNPEPHKEVIIQENGDQNAPRNVNSANDDYNLMYAEEIYDHNYGKYDKFTQHTTGNIAFPNYPYAFEVFKQKAITQEQQSGKKQAFYNPDGSPYNITIEGYPRESSWNGSAVNPNPYLFTAGGRNMDLTNNSSEDMYIYIEGNLEIKDTKYTLIGYPESGKLIVPGDYEVSVPHRSRTWLIVKGVAGVAPRGVRISCIHYQPAAFMSKHQAQPYSILTMGNLVVEEYYVGDWYNMDKIDCDTLWGADYLNPDNPPTDLARTELDGGNVTIALPKWSNRWSGIVQARQTVFFRGKANFWSFDNYLQEIVWKNPMGGMPELFPGTRIISWHE